MSGLDFLVDDLTRIYDEYLSKVDRAVNAFSSRSFSAHDWSSCERLMERFFADINAAVLDPSFAGNAYMARSTFRQVFEPKYGPYPERLVYERIIHGHDGGLNGVIQEAAAVVADTFAERAISNRVDRYLDRQSDGAVRLAASDYLFTFGHLLPKDVTSKGTDYLVPVFGRFLKQHPRLVRKLRNIR